MKSRASRPPGEQRTLFKGKYFDVNEIDGWEFLSNQASSQVVAVLALIRSTHFIAVTQYRPPVQATVLELPAGIAEGAELSNEACREFHEETGYALRDIQTLYTVPVCAGLTSSM